MLDNSIIEVPDNSSRDGTAPSMWGTYCGDENPTVGRFICTFCYRIIKANFPRHNKILNRINEVDGAVKEHWKSPCCIKNVKRIE